FPHRRTRYESLGPALPGFSHGFVGDTFLLTTNPARYVETAAALAAGERQTESFADDDAFAAWRERASRGQGLLDVYVNLRPVWESLRAQSPAADAPEGAGENEALAELSRV